MGFLLEFEGVEDIDLPILDIEEVNRRIASTKTPRGGRGVGC